MLDETIWLEKEVLNVFCVALKGGEAEWNRRGLIIVEDDDVEDLWDQPGSIRSG